MKKISFLLFMLSACLFQSLFCQLPGCPHDTLSDGGMPLGTPLWSPGSTTGLGECPTCVPFDRQNSWQLLDTTQHIQIWGNSFPPCDTVQIVVTSGCNNVTYDSCFTLPLTGAGCLYEDTIKVLPNSQVVALWRSAGTDSMGVTVLSVPVNGRELDSTIYGIDSCMMVSAEEHSRYPEPVYYELGELVRAITSGKLPIPVRKEDRAPWVNYKEVTLPEGL